MLKSQAIARDISASAEKCLTSVAPAQPMMETGAPSHDTASLGSDDGPECSATTTVREI